MRVQSYYMNLQNQETNIFFITGPDKDEFLSLVKPRLKENLFVFGKQIFSTDEVLLSYSWLPKNIIKSDMFAVTANRNKAINLGFSKKHCRVS